MATVSELVGQLRQLGARPGGVLLVHTSFRAVRPVDGGPLGLITALRAAIGPSGTLVMPTMSDGESTFDPRSTPSVGMGSTAELFWRQPGVIRSTHPGASFAAAGPLATDICRPQPLAPPHGPDSPAAGRPALREHDPASRRSHRRRALFGLPSLRRGTRRRGVHRDDS
jgi:aminoglycoside 3-N-acetyltransferase